MQFKTDCRCGPSIKYLINLRGSFANNFAANVTQYLIAISINIQHAGQSGHGRSIVIIWVGTGGWCFGDTRLFYSYAQYREMKNEQCVLCRGPKY